MFWRVSGQPGNCSQESARYLLKEKETLALSFGLLVSDRSVSASSAEFWEVHPWERIVLVLEMVG
jgi:hypothetical protein